MKVKVELNKDQDLPLAVTYTDKMTEEVERAVAFLESSASSGPLIAQQEDRLVIIKPSDVILVRVEGGDTVIYTGKGKYFPESACMRSTSSWARTSCRFPNKPSST
ncbi:hypothetical protein ACXO7R_05815 [Lactobacillus delbrueckii subsp. bulgaricus]